MTISMGSTCDALLSALRDCVLRIDADGTVVTLKSADDPATAQLPVASEPLAAAEVFPPEFVDVLTDCAAQVMDTGAERVLAFTGRFAAGDAPFEARLIRETPTTAFVVVRDLTDTERRDASLREAQKLEALGRLAAGVAHEINTPIQFVAHNAEFMSTAFSEMRELLICYRRALSKDVPLPWEERNQMLTEAEEAHDVNFLLDEVPKAVEETFEGIQRVAVIVRAMKVFSHPTAAKFVPSDLNECLRNAVVVTGSEHKPVADVELHLGELPMVGCVVGELMQVFTNILVNAAQALGDAERGSDRRGQIVVRSWLEGGQAVISFTDDGPGIPAADQARVFEPFFTTKEVGKGTGQGLALSRSIVVDKHHGALLVESTVGEGATFTVRLPLAVVDEPGTFPAAETLSYSTELGVRA